MTELDRQKTGWDRQYIEPGTGATVQWIGGVCPPAGLWSGGDVRPAAAEDEARRLALRRAASLTMQSSSYGAI